MPEARLSRTVVGWTPAEVAAGYPSDPEAASGALLRHAVRTLGRYLRRCNACQRARARRCNHPAPTVADVLRELAPRYAPHLSPFELRLLARRVERYRSRWGEHSATFLGKQRARQARSVAKRRLETAERDAEVQDYRAAGLTMREIAELTGVARSTVGRIVARSPLPCLPPPELTGALSWPCSGPSGACPTCQYP